MNDAKENIEQVSRMRHQDSFTVTKESCGAAPVRKFQDLNSAAAGLSDVKSHLRDLMTLIGINEPTAAGAAGEQPKVCENATLISTLDSLPCKIRSDTDAIHK